jgi:hypothetical protein
MDAFTRTFAVEEKVRNGTRALGGIVVAFAVVLVVLASPALSTGCCARAV